jgi:hypothetical protein
LSIFFTTIPSLGGSGRPFSKRSGARGGDNTGGDSTIRLGNKPPLLYFYEKIAELPKAFGE